MLISVAPLYEHKVYNTLSEMPEILEVYPLFGEYDLIAKIKIESFDELGRFLIEKIRYMKGVLDTKTLTGTEI